MPYAVVEVVEPITLGEKLVDVRQNKCGCDDELDLASVPESVCRVFDDALVVGGEAKRVFVSIGVFSIIKLERRVQLLVPSYDYCVPSKECAIASDNSPCDLFDRIDFPMDEFYPPARCEFVESAEDDPSIPQPEPEPCKPCRPVCPAPYKPMCVMSDQDSSHDNCGCGNSANNHSGGHNGSKRRY